MADKALTPSLHEALIARHFARDAATRETVQDDVLAALHDAMQSGRVAAEKAQRVSGAHLRNEMMTVPARHRKARDDSWKIVSAATKKFDEAFARAGAEIERLAALTYAPPAPTTPVAELRAQEIRSRLAAMSQSDRRKALATAVADDVVVGALLNDPMGTDVAADATREAWRRARYPQEVERLARLRAAMEDAERGGSLLVSFPGTLYDDKVVAAGEASERAVSEALSA